MTSEEAIKQFEERLKIKDYKEQIPEYYSAMELIISALEENNKLKAENERIKSRNCQSCVNKEKCAIFDNFNIDYCSDWEKGGNNGNSKKSR